MKRIIGSQAMLAAKRLGLLEHPLQDSMVAAGGGCIAVYVCDPNLALRAAEVTQT